jgi:Xaa-Pro aminopeptidase
MRQLTGPFLLLGGTDDSVDIYYRSGFRAPDPIVFLENEGSKHLVVSQLEYGRACAVAGRHRTTVVTPGMLGLTGAMRRLPAAWAAALLKREGIKRVTVSQAFPLAAAITLRRSRIGVDAVEQAIFPARAVKRTEEIEAIRMSQRAAVIAMRAAVALIQSSRIDGAGYLKVGSRRLTAADVRRRILDSLLDHECFATDTIVAGGMQAIEPHECGHGALRAHEAIVIDIFPRHLTHGYWGDLTRTVVRGTASPELRKMYAAVRAAHRVALANVRPGVQCGTVHAAAARELRDRGFQTEVVDGKPTGFIHGTGHGVGLQVHEQPSIAPGKTRLRSGHVITIEPGLYYPGVGGIRVEDTVVVTRGGWQYLAPCEKRFEL